MLAKVLGKRVRRSHVGCARDLDGMLKLVSQHGDSRLPVKRKAEHRTHHAIRCGRRQKVETSVHRSIAHRPHRHVDDDIGMPNCLDECPERLGSAQAFGDDATLEYSSRTKADNRIGGSNV
jgi:hypothetical protein